MKKALLLFLIPIFSIAQSLEVNKVDEFTGIKFISTSFAHGKKFKLSDSVAKEGALYISTSYQSASDEEKFDSYFINIFFTLKNNKSDCLMQESGKIILLLENGTKMECVQASKSNCSGTSLSGIFAATPSHTVPDLMESSFLILSLAPINKIRIETSEGYYDYEIKSEERAWLQKHFKLILDEVEKYKAK